MNPSKLCVRLLLAYSECMSDHDDRHRVYMYFQYRNGWQCQFLEANLKTSLPRKLHFTSLDKVVELVERGGGIKEQESRLMLNQAIATGRGGVFLSLTAEQYSKLRSL
jgi:hypothetical protein